MKHATSQEEGFREKRDAGIDSPPLMGLFIARLRRTIYTSFPRRKVGGTKVGKYIVLLDKDKPKNARGKEFPRKNWKKGKKRKS